MVILLAAIIALSVATLEELHRGFKVERKE